MTFRGYVFPRAEAPRRRALDPNLEGVCHGAARARNASACFIFFFHPAPRPPRPPRASAAAGARSDGLWHRYARRAVPRPARGTAKTLPGKRRRRGAPTTPGERRNGRRGTAATAAALVASPKAAKKRAPTQSI
mmetsp:Transcript_11506/g.39865  ORF Transcript_11506/g.39865 Transcript_11506/m.39865 type:complete len:134 (-) Transcript_11506:44-445(-)